MSRAAYDWANIIFDSASAGQVWSHILNKLQKVATKAQLSDLHNEIKVADRLLAESAWPLWQAYLDSAPRTVTTLSQWWGKRSSYGRAVLILDALSLRELPALLAGAQAHGITPSRVTVTGSEVPSDTTHFAKALGSPSRAKLANNNTPAKFILGQAVYTDVLTLPFADCVGTLPHERHIFLWHSWLDDQIHLYHKTPKQIYHSAPKMLQSDDFWKLIKRLCQGRHLLITSDHGYVESKRFTTETDKQVTNALREALGASRYKKAQTSWAHHFMPPLVIKANRYHVVMGQRKWKVQGGFPDLCHGGLSLLEVAVPFVELPPQ